MPTSPRPAFPARCGSNRWSPGKMLPADHPGCGRAQDPRVPSRGCPATTTRCPSCRRSATGATGYRRCRPRKFRASRPGSSSRPAATARRSARRCRASRSSRYPARSGAPPARPDRLRRVPPPRGNPPDPGSRQDRSCPGPRTAAASPASRFSRRSVRSANCATGRCSRRCPAAARQRPPAGRPGLARPPRS